MMKRLIQHENKLTIAAAPSSEQFDLQILRDFNNLYGPPFIPAPLPIIEVISARIPPGPTGPNSSSINNCSTGYFSSSLRFFATTALVGKPIDLML
jgi:hypothetical protein